MDLRGGVLSILDKNGGRTQGRPIIIDIWRAEEMAEYE